MVLENQEENEEYTEQESDRQEQKEKQHIFKLEVGCIFFCYVFFGSYNMQVVVANM